MEIFRQGRTIDSRRHCAGVDYRYCRSQLFFRTAARSDAALPASGASFSVAHIPTTLRNRARASVLSFECKPSGRSGQSGNECIEIFVGVNRSFSIPSSLHSYSFFFIALETVHSLIAKNRPRKTWTILSVEVFAKRAALTAENCAIPELARLVPPGVRKIIGWAVNKMYM